MIRFAIAILGVVLAGTVFIVYTRPTYTEVQTMRAQSTEYDEALDKAQEMQRLKQSLLARFNALNPNDVDRLHKLLPDHVDNVRLILDLDSLAGNYGLGVENVIVDNPETDSGSRTASGLIGSQSQEYDSLGLQFTTRGTYENFSKFLTDLEASLRIVDLEQLKIERDAAPAGKEASGEPTYRFDLAIRTYWLK